MSEAVVEHVLTETVKQTAAEARFALSPTGQVYFDVRGNRLFGFSDSEKLDVVSHLIRRAALMDKQQHLQQSANGVLLLVAVANAGMLNPAACKNKEVVVMGDDDALMRESVRDVIFVGSTQEGGFGGSCHVHSMASKADGDRRPDALVKMIPDHPDRP